MKLIPLSQPQNCSSSVHRRCLPQKGRVGPGIQGFEVWQGNGVPPALGGVAWARLGREDAGLSAWEDEAPRTRGGSCACEGGFRDEGGGFGVIFVRVIVAAAKEEEKEK